MENLFFMMVKAREYKMTKQEDAVVKVPKVFSSVAADPKVSPNWSLKTMTCHSSHCFSIVWG